MKRKFLAVGLAAAAVVSITCGYMTTAMAAGPVNQTEDEDACDLQDIMESIEDEALRESLPPRSLHLPPRYRIRYQDVTWKPWPNCAIFPSALQCRTELP